MGWDGMRSDGEGEDRIGCHCYQRCVWVDGWMDGWMDE